MNKVLHRLLISTWLSVFVAMVGCGGVERPRVLEEETPGQFREMAIDAAEGDGW